MRSIYNRPALLLTLTSLFWSGNFVIGRAIVGVIPPVTLACLRWSLAFLLFLPYAWPYLKADMARLAQSWRMILFLGFIGPACYNTVSYMGLTFTGALNGLVLNAAGPMFIALAAWSLFGDRLETPQFVGMATGFAGVLLIIGQGSLDILAQLKFNAGDLIIVAAMVMWSIYTACLRKRPAVTWQTFNLSMYGIAAVANFPLALIEHAYGRVMTANTVTFACVAYVAVFPSLIAYIMYNRGVELLGASRAGLYLFLVPVFGAVLAMVFLGERLHLFHAVGFAMIIAGVLIGTRANPQPAIVTSDTRPN